MRAGVGNAPGAQGAARWFPTVNGIAPRGPGCCKMIGRGCVERLRGSLWRAGANTQVPLKLGRMSQALTSGILFRSSDCAPDCLMEQLVELFAARLVPQPGPGRRPGASDDAPAGASPELEFGRFSANSRQDVDYRSLLRANGGNDRASSSMTAQRDVADMICVRRALISTSGPLWVSSIG